MKKDFNAKLICFLLISFFLSGHLHAQNIDSTIEKYANKYGEERIYVQYDKPAYAPGETIWFKVYLLKNFFPSDDSKTFYADWTDDRGKLIFRTISPVVDGTTNGQLDIPSNYTGNFIH